MNQYCAITRDISREQKDDFVTLQPLNFVLEENGHPRSTMTIRGSNNVPQAWNVSTIISILDQGNGRHPFTRQPIPLLHQSRARLYQKCINVFPDYKLETLDVNDLFQRFMDTYKEECKLTDEEKTKVRLEAQCFLQVEDLLTIFKEYAGKGKEENRRHSLIDLTKPDTPNWLLRNCSIQDTQYDKAYALSRLKDDGNTYHSLIIHRIGDGFYYNVDLDRNSMIPAQIPSYESSHPTIIHLLMDGAKVL